MTRSLLIAGCAALALAACQKQAATTAASDTPAAASDSAAAAAPASDAAVAASGPAAAAPAPAAADFVMMAAASDMYEIQAAKIAEKRSKTPDVVSFAKMMVTDHTKSTAMVKKAIAESGKDLKPPMTLPADKKAMIDALNNASAQDFDKTYLGQQTMAHQDALMLMTAYSQGGDVPQLKEAAAMILPVVQMHVDMLGKMAK